MTQRRSQTFWVCSCILVQTVVLLSWSAGLFGQQESGVIYGRVTDSRGHSQNLMVHLLAEGDVPAGDVYTDAEGQYAFRSLPGGEYWVVVEPDGFEPVRQPVRLDIQVNSKMQVNLVLEPLAEKGATPSPIVSGSPSSQAVDARKLAPAFDARALREFDKGNASQEKGDFEGAKRHYQRAIGIDARFYPALNNLGAIYERQGDHTRAEQVLLQALQINPNDGESYVNLGHVLYEEGRYPEAAARLEEALKRSPDSATGHFFLGSTYLKLGDLDRAESDLKRACTLDPGGLPAAHLQLANAYLRAHDSIAATTELETYLKIKPDDPQAPAIRKLLARIQPARN
ncbi:MAG TPA: tetratricopeptide repeat protein [Terriglobia bacterium]|nr:tetratricopeptide repeat protein [Terriglobia bacterium]